MKEPEKIKKSDRTKSAILDAARRIFAAQGFEKTTVREIAAASGADPALVVRYFGSKDELFVQAADFSLELDAVPPFDPSQLGNVVARHFLDIWEGEREAGFQVLLRSASSNEHAAARMREIFGGQVLPTLQAFLPAAEGRERAALISSLLLGVALSRYILRLPPLVAIPREELVVMVGRLVQTIAFPDGEAAPSRAP